MKISFLIGLFSTLSWSTMEIEAAAVKSNVAQRDNDLFPLSIIHINDFHARFEETNEQSTSCKEGQKCIGGYARTVTLVKQLLEVRKQTNPIYLNAGDNFQGTLWYSLGRWNVTSHFLNLLKADAMTLGNHEFDHSLKGLVPFLETIESPIVLANMDDSLEPTIQGKYQKSIVIDRYDRKIGIIGVILESVDNMADTAKLRFLNESTAIRKEAQLLKEQGVDIIIVLSHCGLDVDYIIAKNTGPYVDVIVGGHSHTFMYTVPEGGKAPGPDVPLDNYPAVVTHEDGHRVLIVQASAYLKYVGDLTVYFDEKGRVVNWEGAPIFLDTDIVPDPEIMRELRPWKKLIDFKGKEVVGTAGVPLIKTTCNTGECNLGNVLADAFVEYYAEETQNKIDGEWPSSLIAFVPTGAIRTTINAGPITFSDLAMTFPFENSVDTFELRGDHIEELFEHAVEESWQSDRFIGKWLTQVSGLKVIYNMANEPHKRVVSIEVLNTNPIAPLYEPLNPTKYYRCIMQSFFVGGGDGFHTIFKNKINHRTGPIDTDVVIQYFKHRAIIDTELEGRLTLLI